MKIEKCRICGNRKFKEIISLGNQCLTSVYPKPESKDPSKSGLELVLCDSKNKPELKCNLVQLYHNADIKEMYGTTYGYFSSISPTMVSHLEDIIKFTKKHVNLNAGDAVLDIGCNDGTLLNKYGFEKKLKRYGVDPSSEKFLHMFQNDIKVLTDFFSYKKVNEFSEGKKFKVISSIAMFYDIDDPVEFAKSIELLLDDEGFWIIEIAYLPLMMKNLAYDQIMHEHLTYLSLKQMEIIFEKSKLKVVDFSINSVNGGSILLAACKKDFKCDINIGKINTLREEEKILSNFDVYKRFAERIKKHKSKLLKLLNDLKEKKSTIMGYGASTKGNVILNYCGINKNLLPEICDQNPEKPGLVTPGSRIPIISKKEMREKNPDYILVLIWHFRKEVIKDEIDYIKNGGNLIFHLPKVHIVNKNNYKKYYNSDFSNLSFEL